MQTQIETNPCYTPRRPEGGERSVVRPKGESNFERPYFIHVFSDILQAQ